MTNPFETADAGRYARSRPRYQPVVLERAAAILGLKAPVAMALDVGCGTGHSSVALERWAQTVVGVDRSWTMLAAAEPGRVVAYARAAGERLPIRSSAVDLVTVGAAFHWFDRDAFLDEARRVLGPAGSLVVYSDYFAGTVEGAPGVETWIKERYLPRRPGPPRGPALTAEVAAVHGFDLAGEASLSLGFPFDLEGFADYLLTQSNALAALDAESISDQDLREEILGELRPHFPEAAVATARFGARVLCLTRSAGEG